MTGRITGKAYEKHAWMLIFVIGLLGLAGSLPGLFGVDLDPARKEGIIGMTMSELREFNPRFIDLITYANRGYSLINFAWAILIIAISVTAYRRGKVGLVCRLVSPSLFGFRSDSLKPWSNSY